MRPRLHLVGLPHTTTTNDITVCAYTAKHRKFCNMMSSSPFDVTLYWGDRNDAAVAEHVSLHTEEERLRWYPGLTRETVATVGGVWDADSEPWVTTNDRAIREIRERVGPHDMILLAGGWAAHRIAEAFPNHIVCEPGCGYTGWFTNFVAFESHTWRHHCYGNKNIHDGRFYDATIPNYFDPADFPFVRKGSGGYLAFVGRLIRRKGVAVAADIARRADLPLVVAGPGAARVEPGRIVCDDGTEIKGDVTYAGVLGAAERAALMVNAVALLAPTLYIEPFGGVAVEAQMCGTPAVTTNWGAFTETVQDEYRFATIAEGAACVERAAAANRKEIRRRAIEQWSLDAVRPQFERWLNQLHGLWNGGWYADS